MFGMPGCNFNRPLSDLTKQKISETKKINNKNKQPCWFNNGIEEIQIDLNSSAIIPDGFSKGRLASHLNISKQIKIENVLSGEIFIFKSCIDAYTFLEISAPTLIRRCKDGKLVKNRFKCSYN